MKNYYSIQKSGCYENIILGICFLKLHFGNYLFLDILCNLKERSRVILESHLSHAALSYFLSVVQIPAETELSRKNR